jgi:hypothetical protein
MNAPRRRWLQPELWLVVGLPLATLLGGAATLRLATGDLSVDGEAEGVRRTAQVQTAELGPDLAAARRGLQGELRVDRERARISVDLRGDVGADDTLQLSLLHPLHAGHDMELQLQRRNGDWSAALPAGANQRWRLVLRDPAQQWRLVGRLPAGASAARLRPALSAP